MIGSASFWIDLGERAVRAFAQGTVAALGVSAAASPVTSLPWVFATEVGASAAAFSVLIGLGSMKVGDKLTASFLPSPDKTPAMMKTLFRR